MTDVLEPSSRAATVSFRGTSVAEFGRDVRRGLGAAKKSIPCRWLYDAAGSELFEQICGLPAHYLPAAEREILREHATEIAASVAPDVELVDFGSGSARTTRLLVDALLATRPALRYRPVDVCAPALEKSVQALRVEYATLDVRPFLGRWEDAARRVCASPRRKLVAWLGSSVGDLSRVDAAMFLREVRVALGQDDRVLLGVDLRKDAAEIERAYDDAAGVVARFHLHLLERVNRELGGRFDARRFRHRAVYHDRDGRLETSLVAEDAMRVPIEDLGIDVRFAAGEPLHTADSFKYSRAEIAALAWAAGFRSARQWLDRAGRFSLNLLAP